MCLFCNGVCKLRVGEIMWSLMFLCPQKLIFILNIPGGRERIAEYLGSLKQLLLLFEGLRKWLDMLHPSCKSQGIPTGFSS